MMGLPDPLSDLAAGFVIIQRDRHDVRHLLGQHDHRQTQLVQDPFMFRRDLRR